jgi:hypothetical protein
MRDVNNCRNVGSSVPHPEPAVADDIGGKNGSKTTMRAFFGHVAGPLLENAVFGIVLLLSQRVHRPGLLQWAAESRLASKSRKVSADPMCAR